MIQQLPRRERERLTRRQEIIDAARGVFARKGFSDAKLEDVAEQAEFGKGTLYNYFENKEALFASVLNDSFDGMRTIAEETLNSDLPFQEKIDRFVARELSYFFHNPESMHLMMRESHYLRGSNPMMQLLPQLLGMLSETIAHEQKRKKVIDSAEPMALGAMLLNMLFGQFTARVYQQICIAINAGKEAAECSVSEVFGGLTEQDIEREVEMATKLIHTVFFTGIARN